MLRWVPAVKNGMGLRIIRRPQPHVTDFLILSSTQNGPGAGSHHDTPRTGPDGTGLRAARPGGGARRPDIYLPRPPDWDSRQPLGGVDWTPHHCVKLSF